MAKNTVQRRLGLRVPAAVAPAPMIAPPTPSGYAPPGGELVTGKGRAVQAVPVADARIPAPVAEQEQESVISRALRGFNRGASAVPIDPTYNPLGAGLIGGAAAIGAGRQDALERRAAAAAPQQAIDLEVRKETARRQAGEPFDAAKSEREHKMALELARVKAANGGKEPQFGWRYKADGSLEPIPGGPADRKYDALDEKATAGARASDAQATRVIGKIDQALAKVGAFTTGMGSVLESIPGTEARGLAEDLSTIKANLGFAELAAMRQASPTGGALGQVAVKELDFLQATISSLDQSQDPEQLRHNLNEVRTHYVNWQKAVQDAAAAKAAAQAPAGAAAPAAPTSGSTWRNY